MELESKFAKFLTLIASARILSGISSHNKSFFDKKGNYYDVYSDIVSTTHNTIKIEYNKSR